MSKTLKNLCVWAVALFTIGAVSSCDKEETFPSVVLDNQIWYNDATVDVKSAAYELENGKYTIYLSPTAGLTTVQAIKASTDCMIFQTSNPSGISVIATAEYLGNAISEFNNLYLQLSNNKLTLEMKAFMSTGEIIMAKYIGNCPEAVYYPELSNQYQVGKSVNTLGSMVVEHNFTTEATTYYVYEATGVTAVDETKSAAITFTVPLGTDVTSVNLNDVTVKVGDATPNSGTLSLTLTEDKLGNVEGVKLVMEAKDASANLVRASYTGDVTFTGKSGKDNAVSTTVAEVTADADITAVYMQESTGSYKFVFGTNADATTIEELKAENHYAFELTVSADAVKECEITTVDLASTECGFKVYDYTKYGYWDNSRTYEVSQNDVLSGSANITKYGDKIFISFMAELGVNEMTPHAMNVNGDWYGAATVAEIPDMTPVAPVANMFQILDTDGVSIYNNYYRDITSVQVAKVNEKVSGSMDTHDYYYFFFVNKDTETNSGVDGANGTPRIRLRSDFVGKEIDLSKEFEALVALEKNTSASDDDKRAAATSAWHIRYSIFNSSGLGTPAERSYGSAQFPLNGTLKVDFDETTKAVKISFKVQDKYVSGVTDYSTYPYVSTHNPETSTYGSGRWLEIIYDGTGVKYTGKGKSSGFSVYNSVDSMTW